MKNVRAKNNDYEDALLSVLAATTVLFVAIVFTFAIPVSGSFEAQITNAIYNWPIGLKPWFFAITQFGSGWSVAAVVLALWMLRHRILAYTVVVSSLATFAIVELLKTLIERPRPPQVFSQIVSRDTMAIGYGFPSGHAAMATLLAVLLWGVTPKKFQWLLPFIAGLVCLSRIYLGVHSPLDIIGGICVGLIIGLSVKMPWLKIKSSLAHPAHKA